MTPPTAIFSCPLSVFSFSRVLIVHLAGCESRGSILLHPPITHLCALLRLRLRLLPPFVQQRSEGAEPAEGEAETETEKETETEGGHQQQQRNKRPPLICRPGPTCR